MFSKQISIMNKRTTIARLCIAMPAALLLLAATGHAHPGHVHEAGDIGWGLAHPFTGLDHLLAALAAGMLATLWRRASFVVAFLAAGLLGGIGGATLGAFIGLESLLLVSVLAFGLVLALRKHVTQSTALGIITIGAAAHGWAHGSEASGAMSIAGIFLGTAAIVGVGALVTAALQRAPRVVTGLGAGMALIAFATLAGIL